MAKITWLGEDDGDVSGPSFTTCYGLKFKVGQAIEVADADIIARARKNPFFAVEDETAVPQAEEPAAADEHAEDAVHDEEHESGSDDLDKMKIGQLRELAEASGIDHAGKSKAELRDLLREPAPEA